MKSLFNTPIKNLSVGLLVEMLAEAKNDGFNSVKIEFGGVGYEDSDGEINFVRCIVQAEAGNGHFSEDQWGATLGVDCDVAEAFSAMQSTARTNASEALAL